MLTALLAVSDVYLLSLKHHSLVISSTDCHPTTDSQVRGAWCVVRDHTDASNIVTIKDITAEMGIALLILRGT